MKLSDKILIGFFGAITIYMFAAFTEMRLKGDYNGLGDNAKREAVSIGNIRHIALSDQVRNITISSSDDPRLELISRDGGLLSKLQYDLIGDSLIVDGIQLEKKVHFDLIIYFPQHGIAQLDIQGGYANINDLHVSSLVLMQSGGMVFMNRNSTSILSIVAKEDAAINCYDLQVDTLRLDLDQSHVALPSRVRHLEGSMVNGSRLSMGEVNNIVFKQDTTSSLMLSNYNK